MMLSYLKLKIPLSDADFDKVYPYEIRKLSERHFTPFHVARIISEWLNQHTEPLNLLDIGCGVGKFCIITSAFTKHKITGIDIRRNYIDICNRLKDKYQFENLTFLHSNLIEHDLKKYNAFYFFNSFLEQIDETARLDASSDTSPLLYSIYASYLRNQLTHMPQGTIIVTYHVFTDQVPDGYKVIKSECNEDLLMWVKS